MTSLENLPEKYIRIIHLGSIDLAPNILEKYVVSMAEVVGYWRLEVNHRPPLVGGPWPKHYLDVVFPATMKSAVEDILTRNESFISRCISMSRDALEERAQSLLQ